MAKGTVNWDSQETWQRIVAAIIATGVKIDYKQVALHFGTTYDTIESRFRKIKKEAIVLKEEVESGERLDESSSTPKKKNRNKSTTATPKSTPKKDASSYVKNSRISKPSSSTPKNRKKVVKEEEDTNFSNPPRHFDGEDELLGGEGEEGGEEEGGDFSVGFDQEDHLGGDFLS